LSQTSHDGDDSAQPCRAPDARGSKLFAALCLCQQPHAQRSLSEARLCSTIFLPANSNLDAKEAPIPAGVMKLHQFLS